MKQVFLERLLLLPYPGQRQSDRQVDVGSGHVSELQLSGDGGQRQDVVVGIVDLAGQEGLVLLTNDVILALIYQHIVGKYGFPVVSRHAGLEVPMRCLYAAIAMVDGDDDAFHEMSLVSLIILAVTAAYLRGRFALQRTYFTAFWQGVPYIHKDGKHVEITHVSMLMEICYNIRITGGSTL